MNISIKTKIYDTEDEEKIRDALIMLFPNINFNILEREFLGESDSLNDLSKLKELIEKQSIRDTARMIILKSAFQNSVTLYINKQAATVGKVNFSKDCQMGPIKVRIKGKINKILDYLAPSTL